MSKIMRSVVSRPHHRILQPYGPVCRTFRVNPSRGAPFTAQFARGDAAVRLGNFSSHASKSTTSSGQKPLAHGVDNLSSWSLPEEEDELSSADPETLASFSEEPPERTRKEREPELDVAARAKELGVNLSPWEVRALVTMTLQGKAGKVTPGRLKRILRNRMELEAERRTLVEAIVMTHENSPAQRLLLICDFTASALFAVTGTLIAGDAGMNVVGATLVGCLAAMGGGTVNNVLMGSTRTGVFWMRDPRFLAICCLASIITFYGWPQVELFLARSELAALSADSGAPVRFDRFEQRLLKDPALEERLRAQVEPLMQKQGTKSADSGVRPTLRYIFDWLDDNRDGQLDEQDLQRMVRLKLDNSSILYMMDSVALSAFAVIGAQHGITAGMHPVVCAAAGVSICSGGIARDILCHRNLAFGTQSYAMATGCGATVYVCLRQLVVHGYPIPLIWRLLAGGATTFCLRVLDRQNTLLPPMVNRVPCRPQPELVVVSESSFEGWCPT